MAKVMIAIPVYDKIEIYTMVDFITMVKSSKNKVKLSVIEGDGLISRVRNEFAKRFVETDADYLLFVDTDMTWGTLGFNPLDNLISHDKDIVGGLYFTRGKTGTHPVYNPWVVGELPTGIKEVNEVGTGFMLISKKCMEKILDNHKFPFMPMEHNGDYLSEDYAFCKRARDLGFKVFVDGKVRLGHIGKRIIWGEENKCI